jgi:Fe-S cluster biosynthesis and repair protein YggX
MVSNQPTGSDIGKNFYKNVLRPAWERLAARLEMMMDEGTLKRADPWVMAMHWKGLNEWDLFEKRLLGAIDGPPKDMERIATLAADAFLQLYGTNGRNAGGKPVPKQKLKSGKSGRKGPRAITKS